MQRFYAWAAIAVSFALASSSLAEVTRWEITKREPYAGGRPIGERGPCERLAGVVHFALHPNLAANGQIVDLTLAPKNADGKVEFWADFELLVPVDRKQLNGALFYEVNNRGHKTAPGIFDGGADDFLLRQGFAVLWSGWIAEVHPAAGKFQMSAPVAIENGQPIRGIVRNELVVNQPAEKMSISHRAGLGSYRPSKAGLAGATVTMREREADERQAIPQGKFQLHVSEVTAGGRTGQLPLVELEVEGGLKPGWIYEVIYEAEGPIVQGVGLAGIRDLVACLKYDTTERNPLRAESGQPLLGRALGFGTSQSGRCLRQFLYEGFNADEQGRRVFDGVMPHVAGGGLGSFNHRFASPTRTNGQHEEHTFPADYFPFTYGDEKDPFRSPHAPREEPRASPTPSPGRSALPENGHISRSEMATDGILRRSRTLGVVPKVMHTQSSSEYWHRSGSLVHTDPQGTRDAQEPLEVRHYTFGGTQHGAGSGLPAAKGGGQLPSNPADYRPLMRALLLALDAWVKDGKEPPRSMIPRIADKTLVGWKEKESGWPGIPGVSYPLVIHQPSFLDRGPDWQSRRIATVEPPQVKESYTVRVPACGPDGNELGTLNLPAISVPVATYTSWNLRDESIGAKGELLGLQGGYIPLARTKAEREEAGDPRRALLERYRDYADYEMQYMNAANQLLAQRYLLAEDLPRLKALCEKQRGLFEER
jgi:hypothetical protein